MKKLFWVPVLLSISSLALAAPVKDTKDIKEDVSKNGLQGCESKKLAVSIPTADLSKSVEICHVNGLTFNIKYGAIGKPELDLNFMGLKSGGYAGEGDRKVAFAVSHPYKYTLTIGKEISEFVIEYKKGDRYQKIEQVRLVNSLNKAEWEYWDKFSTNTNYTANNIEIPK